MEAKSPRYKSPTRKVQRAGMGGRSPRLLSPTRFEKSARVTTRSQEKLGKEDASTSSGYSCLSSVPSASVTYLAIACMVIFCPTMVIYMYASMPTSPHTSCFASQIEEKNWISLKNNKECFFNHPRVLRTTCFNWSPDHTLQEITPEYPVHAHVVHIIT